ncbi:MAG: hypothetical protein NTW29_09790 [Bacteroidetes bacterium]|nr:hypothetical protein [Bacteroidota bacterium]
MIKPFLFSLFICAFAQASQAQSSGCIAAFPEKTILFSHNTLLMPAASRKKLDSTAAFMKKNPDCRLVVNGYGSSCIKCQQFSWDKVYFVIQYLRAKGIDSTRFIFVYALDEGDPETVTIRGVAEGEDGPNMVPPPVPCLSRHQAIRKQCHTR